MKLKINNNKGEVVLNFDSEVDNKETIKSYGELPFKTFTVHMKENSNNLVKNFVDTIEDEEVDYVEITLK